MKSDKSNISSINSINFNDNIIDDQQEIANSFNYFFTNFKSDDKPRKSECSQQIFHHFKNLKIKGIIKPTLFSFIELKLDDL